MKNKNIAIVWFRQDLRLSDNPALNAVGEFDSVLPIYILDDNAPNTFKLGAASKVWLHYSLEQLNKRLLGKLNLYQGEAFKVIKKIVKQYQVKAIFWNTCFEPWQIRQADTVKAFAEQNDIECQSFNGNYLWHPDEILKKDNSYYKVYSAYKRQTDLFIPHQSTNPPKKINSIKDNDNSLALPDLQLLPQNKKWPAKLLKHWDIGEMAAQKKLKFFIENHLQGYRQGRDFPMKNQTSQLSPHLHFGEISAVQIWESVKTQPSDEDSQHFLSELLWREFSVYLLYHFNQLPSNNFNPKFDNFPWRKNSRLLKLWQKGQTGFPIVDAGMRQLWQTGYMHNRVRMIVASFLVKNLNIHWHDGRDWFWDCLFDADLANNSASWQWVAGSGADAAPYFRIFNPILQGEKFDKTGEYTRAFVPELKNLPDRYLFKSWMAPEKVLDSAGVVLGKTYPKPIVDLQNSRNEALAAYKSL